MKRALILLTLLYISNTSFSQVSDQKILDSIFKSIKGIRLILDNAETHKEEVEKYKKILEKDSSDLKKNDNKIKDLIIEVSKLELEKSELKNKISHFQDSLKIIQSVFSEISDEQIENLLDGQFDKPGNLVLGRDMMLSILSFAQKTSPKKLNQFNAYLEIYDSIISIRKTFDAPYNILSNQSAVKSIANLELMTKKKLPDNKSIKSEVENLKKLVSRYCSNTSELYNLFFRIAPLAETTFISDLEVKSSFRSEVEKAYFLVFQYKYLNEMLNKFLLESAFREQFKNKPTFTCN